MPISKIGTKALVDCSVAAVDIADNSITAAKLAGSITNAKLANSSVTINSTSVSLGASANINALDWQSVITADGSTGTTGVAGRGYFINTTSAAHTFTLPSSATRGDTIAIKDYAGTFATFNLTIARNGHNIQGVANNSLISTNRASVVLVYVDVTRGWEFTTESNVAYLGIPATFISATGGTVATSGDFKIHTFTGDGCFVVSTIGNAPTVPTGGPSSVDYLVIAGGGGGGGGESGNGAGGGGGGGGAGGYRYSASTYCGPANPLGAGSALTITTTTYPITVGGGGGGGAGAAVCAGVGDRGSNSIFSTITSTGGGGGSGCRGSPYCNVNRDGGSGGGNSGDGEGGTGAGNTPPVSPPQGNNGSNLVPNRTGGGGGGAGAAFATSTSNGGSGDSNSITNTPVTRSGGGGGGGGSGPRPGGSGGPGGGGQGGNASSSGSSGCSGGQGSGSSNTGSGGGGKGAGGTGSAGSGGKGIVIIRYKFQ